MKTVITIQHTQAIHHTNGMVGSWTDWALTDPGKAQAENIGRRLSAELAGKPCKIYSSDLLRARQTAEPLARFLEKPVEYRTELRELNLGAAVGRTKQWMRENAKPVLTMDDRPFPDAESGKDVWNRLSAFCSEIEEKDDEIVILVAHGFCLPMWFAVWQRWDIGMFEKADFVGIAGGVSWMFENDDGKRIIGCLNDMSYMEEDAR